MLVLARKKNERVFITIPPSAEPVRVELKMIDTGNSQARVGIDAPRS